MTSSSKKILFLSLSGIGNFIMQSPVFKLVKTAHPDWHITVWVAPRGTKALAEANPYIDEVFEAPIKKSPLTHIPTAFRLSTYKFDYAVVLTPGQLFKSAALLFLAGVPERVGHTYPWQANPHSHFLLTKWVDEKDNTHDVEKNLELLPLVGIEIPTMVTNYELAIPANKKAAGDQWILQHRLSDHPNLLGFHPGSAAELPAKRWPIENFAALGNKLISEKQAHILLFGGPDEQLLLEELHAQFGVHSTIVSTDLLTVAAIMQHCKLFISNDSGLMHLAAASGINTYGLFGPTNEALTGPRSPHSHVIRAAGTHPVYSTELNPDLGNKPHKTMNALKPKEVYNKLLTDS